MTGITDAPALPGASAPANPYIGPRAFREGELFFGRDREASGLVDTLVAGRIVLLHSPSGAGKTSLIQAKVVPQLMKHRFQICAQLRPRFSAVRVGLPLPEGAGAINRYVASAVTCLVPHLITGPEECHAWTLSRALDALASEQEEPSQQLLVLDQFEEILTTDPTDFEGQRTFFQQLGEALDNDQRWALIAMREDFMGGLDRFLRYIPGQLRSTYRLDLLDTDGALQAIQLPARVRGVDFEGDAASQLLTDLQMVRTGLTDQPPRRGTYVEPVLLQVVCDNLWRKLSSGPFTHISTKDIESFGPLDTALRRYYSFAVRSAAGRDDEVERAIRDWIQERLLTKQGLRSQTGTYPEVPQPVEALTQLQKRYLIRSDPRPGATWWELSHDRLAEPILEDNREWRERKLELWQRKAYRWHRERHNPDLLLKGEELRQARYAGRRGELTEIERDFLNRSAEVVANQGRLQRAQASVDLFRLLFLLSLSFNILAIVVLVVQRLK